MSSERKYVLVSAKWTENALVFWGSLTKDDEERSYGGYTTDMDACERYTLEEAKQSGSYVLEKFVSGRQFWDLKRKDGTCYATEEELIEAFNQPERVIHIQ